MTEREEIVFKLIFQFYLEMWELNMNFKIFWVLPLDGVGENGNETDDGGQYLLSICDFQYFAIWYFLKKTLECFMSKSYVPNDSCKVGYCHHKVFLKKSENFHGLC
jgi:hypothetical protein